MRDSTAKVAFAAYLHDLGKFAEQAKLDVPDLIKGDNPFSDGGSGKDTAEFLLNTSAVIYKPETFL